MTKIINCDNEMFWLLLTKILLFRVTVCPSEARYWRSARCRNLESQLTFPFPIPKVFGIRDRTMESSRGLTFQRPKGLGNVKGDFGWESGVGVSGIFLFFTKSR
ncbi:MAG: hypothetical protein B6I19_02010 [Bacteroidetes bacterium 4572_114]|nr:MAG: hypothetical protein B6I19_02010 [Bacteroidetes bacterium 4572_114]